MRGLFLSLKPVLAFGLIIPLGLLSPPSNYARVIFQLPLSLSLSLSNCHYQFGRDNCEMAIFSEFIFTDIVFYISFFQTKNIC